MLLKANPYYLGYELRQGKTHKLDDENPHRTMCGKTVEGCPGQTLDEKEAPVDCKVCLNAIETKKRNLEWQRKWQIESQQRELERERQNAEWWQWYNSYLLTDEWQQRRRSVLRRANGLCEGCGSNRATQIHHLTYERVGNEMLFDLVAVCHQCHEAIHPLEK